MQCYQSLPFSLEITVGIEPFQVVLAVFNSAYFYPILFTPVPYLQLRYRRGTTEEQMLDIGASRNTSRTPTLQGSSTQYALSAMVQDSSCGQHGFNDGRPFFAGRGQDLRTLPLSPCQCGSGGAINVVMHCGTVYLIQCLCR